MTRWAKPFMGWMIVAFDAGMTSSFASKNACHPEPRRRRGTSLLQLRHAEKVDDDLSRRFPALREPVTLPR